MSADDWTDLDQAYLEAWGHHPDLSHDAAVSDPPAKIRT
jgi:hypothetical protein